MYDIPAVPTFPDSETQLRVETSALRRRMLEGSHKLIYHAVQRGAV